MAGSYRATTFHRQFRIVQERGIKIYLEISKNLHEISQHILASLRRIAETQKGLDFQIVILSSVPLHFLGELRA